MKRFLSGALVAALLSSGIAAYAYEVPNINTYDNIIKHETYNCDAQAQAEMLNKLGLFAGTGKGFELDRSMTRAEAAAMLCRFLGGAAEAEKGGYPTPFTDVPAWAANSVGWLYQNQLTYGISKTQYGSSQPVTPQQFAAFLSRALTGEDDMIHQLLTENEASNLEGKPFLRSYAVAMAVRALPMECYRDGLDNVRPLAKKLIEQGVFTAEQFTDAAWDVLPPTLDGDTCMIAGIPRMECSEKGLTGVWESVRGPQPFYYATRQSGGTLEFWRVSWETMQAEKLGEQPALGTGSVFAYLGTVQESGKDYLLEKDSALQTGRLFSISGSTVTLALDKDAVGKSYLEDSPTSGGSFAFDVEDGVCVIDSTGVHIRKTAAPGSAGESTVLYTGSGFHVTQTVTEKETTIASIRSDTGETISSYSVPQDLPGEPRTVQLGKGGFIGEAGMYEIYSEDGTLRQWLDTAVHDCFGDFHGNAFVCLTHATGKRIPGMNGCGGDTLVLVDASTGKRTTLVDSSAEISIAGLVPSSATYAFQFFSVSDAGMQHFDKYTYDYDGSGQIKVADFEAGRPEVMKGWDSNNPDAYKKAYIEAEQARIDATWNSKH